ncbi:hypothetical protein BDZ97DRAFT_1149417 [Flammula alnicola]|nr:hypothetical protein BDZ97DRAFT_1149417 [Flammula alnicola]
MQLQNDQGEWVRAEVLNPSVQNQPYDPQGPTPSSAYYPNAPPHSLPHHSSTPASFQQAGHGGADIASFLHIPCVKKLYEAYFGLSGTVTRLCEENHELREGLARLNGELAQSPQLEGPENYAVYRHPMSGSLAPSDSLSQRLSRQSSGSFESREIQRANAPLFSTPHTQPTTRPNDLPFEVLWQRDDCKLDKHGARPIKSNSSRPRMKSAIRDKDGTPIDKGHFKTIQKSVKTQVAILIQEEEEQLKRSLPTDKITKTYFESCRAKQWLHAIAVIEDEHPILAYAAAHWKAEQLLTNRLTSRRSHHKKASGHQSKKMKRSAKGNGRRDGGSETSEEEDSEEEADEGGSKEKAAAGLKRKRAKSVSNPSDMLSTSSRPLVAHGDMTTETSETTVRPPHALSLSLISVNATYDGLKDIFSTMFNKNTLPRAIELLEALEKISGSAALNSGSPSSTVLQFIERIESADPNTPDIDEHDTNIGWGHSQFTSGGLTCRSVLQTWSDIGNVKTAHRLLAASLKTCLVARHLCFTNKILMSDLSSYLSDTYLCEVVEILWNFRAQDTSDSAHLAAAGHASTAAATIEASAASGSTQIFEPASHVQEPNENSKRLERLHADELKTWMADHSIPLPARNRRKKHDLIATIIHAGGEKIPSDEDISRSISQRTSHKRGSATKPA